MSRFLHFGTILRVLSINLFIIAISQALCAGITVYFSEDISPFLYSSLIALITGFIFRIISKYGLQQNNINRKSAYITVVFSWIILGLTGALPYLFSGTIHSFVNSFFESVSGFTTTGSSILTDIESLPKSILFWRSLTHWIGGIGIIILVIIVLPSLKMGVHHLFTLESSFREKIRPRIKSVGSRLLLIYVSLTVLETILLLAGHMNLFDSLCHSFGTIATGGFSPKNTSIANYSSYIQYVIMIFMLLAGTNFAVYYYIITKKISKVKNNEEFKFYIFIIIIVGTIISSSLAIYMHKPVGESFREGFFQVISIITCTGYSTADYLQWPVFAWVIIFFMMFLGGSIGSTAGGIKIVRHLVFLKNIRNIFRQLISPKAVLPVKINNKALSNKNNSATLTFISMYLLIFVISTIILVVMGIDIESAGGSVATCMAGIGPGIGTVGPASNFAHFPVLAKILLTLLMIIGRLEIYSVIVFFSKGYWKK